MNIFPVTSRFDVMIVASLVVDMNESLRILLESAYGILVPDKLPIDITLPTSKRPDVTSDVPAFVN